ncbi:MAG TPA: SDR family oxidoreductase [Pirellulaceae bacterium]|nr:SDR family oxidoreductase [Pirellulaceae bacterium]
MSFWTDKVVVVTGGSAGLGLEIARALGPRGAKIGIVARDEGRLRTAVQELETNGAHCVALAADVTDEGQVQQLVGQINHRLGPPSVLINNVGASTRRAVIEVRPDEYRQFFELNFMSAVNMTRALLPALVQQRGSIVNIGSLASKTAWPLIAPYAVGKAALGAYTQQLRLELAPTVHVMLVCPGPLKRAESSSRYVGTEGLPLAAQLPGAGARVARIRPEWLAQKILRGCERKSPEIIVPFRAKLLFALAQLSPRLGDWMLRRMAGASQARVDPVDFFRTANHTSDSTLESFAPTSCGTRLSSEAVADGPKH